MLQHNNNKEVRGLRGYLMLRRLGKKMSFLAVFVFFLCRCYSHEVTGEDKPIQAFVVPHSHMDVGWVYTIQVGLLSPQSS